MPPRRWRPFGSTEIPVAELPTSEGLLKFSDLVGAAATLGGNGTQRSSCGDECGHGTSLRLFERHEEGTGVVFARPSCESGEPLCESVLIVGLPAESARSSQVRRNRRHGHQCDAITQTWTWGPLPSQAFASSESAPARTAFKRVLGIADDSA